MAIEPRRFHAGQETRLAEVLAEAQIAPVLVEQDGMVYRVSAETEDLRAGYDPAAVRHALQRYADLLTPEEGKVRIAAIYRSRQQGNRPASRP